MTNDDKSRSSDADMRQAWRQVSDESPPPDLDRAVTRAARRSRGGLARWSQPLALAATLLLGVLLVYTTQSPLRGPEATREEATAGKTAEPAPASRVAPGAGQQRRQKPAARVVAPPVAGDVAHPATGRQDAQAEGDRFTPAAEEAETAATAARTSGKTESPACSAEQRTSADRWWLCIEDLAAAGNQAVADAEMQRLQVAFPDFTVPE